jgi:hypothetical protein
MESWRDGVSNVDSDRVASVGLSLDVPMEEHRRLHEPLHHIASPPLLGRLPSRLARIPASVLTLPVEPQKLELLSATMSSVAHSSVATGGRPAINLGNRCDLRAMDLLNLKNERSIRLKPVAADFEFMHQCLPAVLPFLGCTEGRRCTFPPSAASLSIGLLLPNSDR